MLCPVCASAFAASGRRRYCSDACKQRAWRDQRAEPRPSGRVAPAETVYACPSCDTRYLGQRRCPDCNLFTTSLGPGAPCPHCDEPIALIDVIPDYQPNPKRPR